MSLLGAYLKEVSGAEQRNKWENGPLNETPKVH